MKNFVSQKDNKTVAFKENAQFVQKVTFEPLMDFRQNRYLHYGSWKILEELLLLKAFFT